MQIKGHVADLVQKQRAAIGLLKAAPAGGLRARERTALVAKQFALEQILRDGGGVDGHKGLVGAGRVFVQRVRHQLFARARLARDEHRDMALRQTADAAEHVLHGRGLTQHLRRIVHFFFGHVFALALAHGAADQLHRLGQVKGLGQVLKRAALEGRHRAVQIRKRRHDDDGQTGHALLDGSEQIQPRAAGHADVADQHLRAVALAFGLQRLQHLAWVGEAAGGQSLAQQCFFKHKADGLVIVYDPDRLHQRGAFCGHSCVH